MTAFSHPANISFLLLSSMLELKVCLPLALTFSRVFGSLTSHPKRPTAEAARRADPKAVDLKKRRDEEVTGGEKR